MGFNTNSLRFGAAAGASTNQDASWKSQGFLNLYLPKVSGDQHKLGFIGLKESDPVQAELLKMLTADASKVSLILANLIIEYRSAVVGNGKGLSMFGGQVPDVEAEKTEGAEKARGYLNYYLPDDSSTGKAKVGFTALKLSHPFERQIIEACETDEAQAIEVLKDNLSMDYRSATSTKGSTKPSLKLKEPEPANS